MTTTIQDDIRQAKDIRQAVHYAVGAASTAWERLEGTGVFDDGKAVEISDALLDRIEDEVADAAFKSEQASGYSALEYDPDFPRRFLLERSTDVSGVSGTGVVVWGVVFPDGRVAYRWKTPLATTCTADSVDDVVAIHGHNGATELVWIDPPFFAKGAVL